MSVSKSVFGDASGRRSVPTGTSMHRLCRLLGVALLLGAVTELTVTEIEAQYNSPAFDREGWEMPDKEDLQEAYEEARWAAGPLRFHPWLGVRDASFVTTQVRALDGTVTETDDFTATAGAGLRIYARSSPKWILALHALPEYVWWQDDDAKSSLNGRYGAGVFGFMNRLKVEASARRIEKQDLFSTEIQELTSVRHDVTRLGVDVEALRNIHVEAGFRSTEVTASDKDRDIFRRLDRTENASSVGIRLESERGFSLGLGVRDFDIELENEARNLSADGSSVYLRGAFESTRFTGLVDVEQLELSPTLGSDLSSFEELVGAVRATWELSRFLGLQLYQEQNVTFSVTEGASHFRTRRTGLTTELKSKRSSLSLTFATGDDELVGQGGDALRTDDVTELRAALWVPIGELTLQVYGTALDYDSNVDAFDRDFSSFGVALDLGRLARRLSLGDAESLW